MLNQKKNSAQNIGSRAPTISMRSETARVPLHPIPSLPTPTPEKKQ